MLKTIKSVNITQYPVINAGRDEAIVRVIVEFTDPCEPHRIVDVPLKSKDLTGPHTGALALDALITKGW